MGAIPLTLALLGSSTACDDGEQPGDIGPPDLSDTATDGPAADPDAAAEQDLDEPDLDEPDLDEPDLDEPELTGSSDVFGSVFNNTGNTEGRLTVAVYPLDGTIDAVVASQVIDAPSAAQSYRLEDVPAGSYRLTAMLDVGDPNDLGDPGLGDLVGEAPSPLGFDGQADEVGPFNVEIQ